MKKTLTICLTIALGLTLSSCSQKEVPESPWNADYDFISQIPAISFHYDHGVLAGSYPPGKETTEVSYNDVSRYLGHVCLCGAGGYRVSQIAVDLIGGESVLEKGEFTLISSRDHTISDVIAYTLGCIRRSDLKKNQYFVDPSIEAPRREYHYFIGYHPQKKAVHIIYRKHLLTGNDQMDRLWKIEQSFEEDPSTVTQADMELYQNTMLDLVKDVLLDRKEGVFEAELIDYDEYFSSLN